MNDPLTLTTSRSKVVYVADIDKVADLESRISRKYWDFKEIEDEYNRCYIERQKEALDEAEFTEYQGTLRKIRSVHQRAKEAAKLKSRGVWE
jgi:hypothetical protein